jgi:PBP1b-binding outer membrane lipoprotein LpoB
MKYIVTILLTVTLYGCASSPLSRHSSSDVINSKSNNQTTILLADAVIVDGLISDTDVVNVVENKRLAKLALQMFAGRMNEKGYSVDRLLNTSVGILMNSNIPYRVNTESEDKKIEIAELEIGKAPFYLHDLFVQDTLRGKLLTTVYSSLMENKRLGDYAIKNIPAATYLSKSLGGGLIGVIFIGGYNAGVTNEYGKYLPPTSQTEDKVAIRKISRYSMMFYLIDGSSGEIVWDDEVNIKGGEMYNSKLQDMVNEICNKLL